MAGLVVVLPNRSEPTYKGRNASYWLTLPNKVSASQFAGTFGIPGSSFGDFDAFQAMGSNVWAYLAAAAHRHESWPSKQYRYLYTGWLRSWQPHLPDPGPPGEEVRIRAIEIMAGLQPQPTNLVATLYSLLDDESRAISDLALRHLLRDQIPDEALAAEICKRPLQNLPVETALSICNGLKPDFHLVRPFIEELLYHKDPNKREDALVAAQNCSPDPYFLKQYAVAALHDPDADVRYRAVYLLLDIGTNATSAVPELWMMLADDSVIVRNAARKAIAAITGSKRSLENESGQVRP